MILFGLIGAGAKLSGNRLAQRIASAYTVIFRGTPEILVILLLYYGSAITLTAIAQIFNPEIKFVDVPPFWAGTIAISLIVGSYATETFRGAFLGVNPGSIEAARALGMSNLQTFIYIRIPEMWRIALPPFGNHMLSLTKDTALISIIGLNETLFVAKQDELRLQFNSAKFATDVGWPRDYITTFVGFWFSGPVARDLTPTNENQWQTLSRFNSTGVYLCFSGYANPSTDIYYLLWPSTV